MNLSEDDTKTMNFWIMVLNSVLGVVGALAICSLILTNSILFYVVKKARDERIKKLEEGLNE